MSYSSEVLADSPLAYWRLGESAGATMADSSGNGRVGIYAGSLSLGAAGLLVGDPDASVDFAGGKATRTYDAAWMVPSAWTVEAWITPDTLGALMGIVTRHNTSGGESGAAWDLFIDNATNRFLARTCNPPGVFNTVTSATVAAASAVYHLAVTHDGTTLRLYINGALDGSVVAPGPQASPSDLVIGSFGGATSLPFDGRIDDVAFYGTALSEARIKAHYDAGTGAIPSPEVTFAAVAPAAAATFNLSRTLPGRDITLAGTAPAATAAFTLEHAEPAPAVNEVSVAAIAPAAIGAFVIEAPISGPTITFAAVAPAATAAFTLLGPLTTTTDLLSDVSEGYNYDGESDVLDDGTAGSIPAGIRLAPIRIVHQALPAPVLVNGRPRF